MPYTTTIQIEPSTKKHLETKRQSFYTCIRYASKLMKLGTDLRKHRTIPDKDNHIMQVVPTSIKSFKQKGSNYNYEEDETVTLYDEKCEIENKNCHYSTRVDSQLALPSRLKYVVVSSKPITFVHQLNNNEDEEEYEEKRDGMDNDYNTDSSNYVYRDNTSYSSTLQKLSGISFTSANNKQSTAVLITLSPCALAAANAARQRRQKIRVNK